MNYRNYKFLATTGNLTSGTLVHDINMQDPISTLIIRLAAHNSQAAMTAHPCAIITKIELVDGSDILYSLDGFEAEAVDWYAQGGRFRQNWNYAINGMFIDRFIGLNFGRYLWDPEYAFDPSRFDNPQLRVSYICTNGANASDYIQFTMWANMFDGKVPSLRGFLMNKEIKKFTGVATQHEYTDMPRDHVYRNLYIRCYKTGTDADANITNVKLTEDQDKKIPFNDHINVVTRNLMAEYGVVREEYFINVGAVSLQLYNAATTRVNATMINWNAASSGHTCNTYNGEGGDLDLISSGAGDKQVHVTGGIVHGVWQIPFGLKDEPDDWYDVRSLGSLQLDLTMANTPVCHIFVQQARDY